MSNGNKTFVRITNKMIWEDLQHIKKAVNQVGWMKKWLYGLTGAFGVAFLFIIKMVAGG